MNEKLEIGINGREKNAAEEAREPDVKPIAPETAGDGEKDWQAEAENYRDLCLRTQAEMENMKKRLEKEKSDFVKFANESMIKDLLGVLDNLERALTHAEQNREQASDQASGLLEGVRMTYDGFWQALRKHGVKPVSAAGEKFDPRYHQAVMQREDAEAESGTVLEEIQKGYILHERLIRPSMVVVSQRPAGEQRSEN